MTLRSKLSDAEQRITKLMDEIDKLKLQAKPRL